MKKFLSVVLVAVMAMSLLAGCGGKNSDSKLEQIQKRGKLIMATDAAWAPFEYIDASEKPVGSDIDLAQEIANGLGVELEILNVAFDSLATVLQNGDADIAIAAMTITDERKEAMDFSIPYTVSQQYIIVPEEDGATANIEDLAGKAIGTHLGTTGDFLVDEEINGGCLDGTGATESQYKNLAEGCIAMKNGDLQAIVCDSLLAQNLCAVNEGLKCFPATYADGSATDESYGIAFKKGDDEFVNKVNEIIKPLVEDGTIDGYILDHQLKASLLAE